MLKNTKYLFALFAVLLMTAVEVNALSAKSAILIDKHSGRVLQQVNAYQRMGMASTTKIMTALVTLENADLDKVVQVSQTASSVEGSSMWLEQGEQISIRDLLYGLMLNSGNDAATALAECIGGSIEGFADMMNAKAAELGLKDTHFTNPHGLDDEQHYTTAYDLAQLTRHALHNEMFAEIVATRNKIVSWDGHQYGRHLSNHNKMLRMYEGADGVKTGFTKKDGRCLVSSATRNEMTLIAVTLCAGDDWNDHKQMLNYGFENYELQKIVTAGQQLTVIPATKSASDFLSAVAKDDLAVVVKKGELPEVVYDLPREVSAPLPVGQAVGTAYVKIGDEMLASTEVLSGNELKIKKVIDMFDDKNDTVVERFIDKIKDVFD